MKIALISDIHGNIYALEAVMDDILRQNVDFVVNLGDVLYGPIAPKATYDLLQQHDFITIRGNQDRQIAAASADERSANPTMQFVWDDFDGEVPLNWLKNLPVDRQLTPEIYLCHGAPGDDAAYLLEDVQEGYPRLRAEEEILKLLKGWSSQVIICGHTHIARTVTLSSGQLIVNPGSVGLPAYTDEQPVAHSMENGTPHAAYAILAEEKWGWGVRQVNVPYDFCRAAKDAEKRQRSDWAHFLTTGRTT